MTDTLPTMNAQIAGALRRMGGRLSDDPDYSAALRYFEHGSQHPDDVAAAQKFAFRQLGTLPFDDAIKDQLLREYHGVITRSRGVS